MKTKFSTMWRKSRQTRKQRKYAANAPMHIKHVMMNSNLSKELRKKYGKRSFSPRKGDEAKIMAGKMKGRKGKIVVVNYKKGKIAIEGIQEKKKDGTKVNIWFHPSNIQLQELNLDDKKRNKSLERKAPVKKEKPQKENKTHKINKDAKEK